MQRRSTGSTTRSGRRCARRSRPRRRSCSPRRGGSEARPRRYAGGGWSSPSLRRPISNSLGAVAPSSRGSRRSVDGRRPRADRTAARQRGAAPPDSTRRARSSAHRSRALCSMAPMSTPRPRPTPGARGSRPATALRAAADSLPARPEAGRLQGLRPGAGRRARHPRRHVHPLPGPDLARRSARPAPVCVVVRRHDAALRRRGKGGYLAPSGPPRGGRSSRAAHRRPPSRLTTRASASQRIDLGVPGRPLSVP